MEGIIYTTKKYFYYDISTRRVANKANKTDTKIYQTSISWSFLNKLNNIIFCNIWNIF